MIRIAQSDEFNLDKEISVSMTLADLAIIYALVANTSDETIKSTISTLFTSESIRHELGKEVDSFQMYKDAEKILNSEGVRT